MSDAAKPASDAVRMPQGLRAAAPRRDEALDMVKGMLVVGMLVIHSANLFLDSVHLRYLVYPVALGFVSGSWVFISGFLISSHYQSSFNDDVGGTTRRLLGRGLRLLAIFLGVNLLLGKISLSCPDGYISVDCQPWRLLVLGDNAGMTFEILEGIAYVLMVSPFYMALPGAGTVIIAVLIVGATLAPALGYSAQGLSWMILVGMAGIVLGWTVPAGKLQELVRDPRKRLLAATVGLLAWGAYQAVTYLPDPHDLLVGGYVVCVGGMVLFLYVANGWISWGGYASRAMNLMARYALFCYMGQMAILMAWRVLTRDSQVFGSFPLSFVAGLVMLVAMIEALDRLRRRFPLVDRGYQMVLG